MISNTNASTDHASAPWRERAEMSAIRVLSFAAAPTFALMALATALSGAPDVLCVSVHATSPLTGMAAMYLLMSAFHCAPWLRLISRRRGYGM